MLSGARNKIASKVYTSIPRVEQGERFAQPSGTTGGGVGGGAGGVGERLLQGNDD